MPTPSFNPNVLIHGEHTDGVITVIENAVPPRLSSIQPIETTSAPGGEPLRAAAVPRHPGPVPLVVAISPISKM
jgi:hypothetical protein